ncbi:hypothetical protein ED21_25658 [Erythrobacter sp. SD-21]|nr:hypothetical protein ED21_25658 [Erythrobacter sp. SD-21]
MRVKIPLIILRVRFVKCSRKGQSHPSQVATKIIEKFGATLGRQFRGERKNRMDVNTRILTAYALECLDPLSAANSFGLFCAHVREEVALNFFERIRSFNVRNFFLKLAI